MTTPSPTSPRGPRSPRLPGRLYAAGTFLSVHSTPAARWSAEIAARPAVKRGRRVNKVFGNLRRECAGVTTPRTSTETQAG